MTSQYSQPYVANASEGQSKQLCENGYLWIWRLLKQCVENVWEYWSVVMGLVSVFFFLFAAVPQIYVAYKNGKVDQALSMGFLLLWLAGDLTNALGCFLTQQQPIQIVTAILYINMDIIMISQFAYYKAKNQKRKWSCSFKSFCFSCIMACISLSVILPSHFLLIKGHTVESVSEKQPHRMHEMLGFMCGYVSSIFYLGSRFPQLYKNFQRKSTEGTSYGLFALSMMGNCTYGLSLILKMPASAPHRNIYVMHHLPWLFGSFGVVVLDIFVTVQFVVYHKRKKVTVTGEKREKEPLLLVSEDC